MAAFAFARAILAGSPVRIFKGPGGSELSRDFTYVDDIVAGVLAALASAEPSARPAPPPRIFNLGNTRPVNVSHFVSLLEQKLGVKALRQHVSVPTTGDVLFTSADTSAAQLLLGYAPRVGLEEGLGRFAAWFTGYYGSGRHKEDVEENFARRRGRALAQAGGREAGGAAEEETWLAEGEEDAWRADGEGS
jgi:UDP-glucuronate 4-epimerase